MEEDDEEEDDEEEEEENQEEEVRSLSITPSSSPSTLYSSEESGDMPLVPQNFEKAVVPAHLMPWCTVGQKEKLRKKIGQLVRRANTDRKVNKKKGIDPPVADSVEGDLHIASTVLYPQHMLNLCSYFNDPSQKGGKGMKRIERMRRRRREEEERERRKEGLGRRFLSSAAEDDEEWLLVSILSDSLITNRHNEEMEEQKTQLASLMMSSASTKQKRGREEEEEGQGKHALVWVRDESFYEEIVHHPPVHLDFLLPASSIIPLPRAADPTISSSSSSNALSNPTNQQHTFPFSPPDRVFALFPETTAFYPAILTSRPYLKRREGDGGTGMFVLVQFQGEDEVEEEVFYGREVLKQREVETRFVIPDPSLVSLS